MIYAYLPMPRRVGGEYGSYDSAEPTYGADMRTRCFYIALFIFEFQGTIFIRS